ncbi:3,4-dihydroxy-2-butanone-4-phosphate synthase [Mycobacterium sp. M26]|uniref:3,4-dihydroxy-2-butanone-4-phosphate synthase n=1 Tax=Mycobacterium sp. M26 TaxID=1762962 RepID=UPI00073F764A|nr:3,4-dihydroxy-2-butanone-4-phosphate synthase [Mycobacterium sp. M26]
MRTAHGRVRRAISAVAMGRAVVVVDETAAQGYLMYAADAATPALLAFTVRHTSGYVRVALPAEDCERLDLPPICLQPTASTSSAAHRVAVDACGVGTGISATDRALTIATLAAADATAADFRRPGHVVPVLAGPHGVLDSRAGGAEAAIDLATLAGRRPSGVLCEIVSQRHPAGMADDAELASFAEAHRLPMVSIAEIAAYRRRLEPQVMRCAETALPAAAGDFRAVGYRGVRDDCEHLAILAGPAGADAPMPLHVHVECLSGDVFGSMACRCGRDLDAAVAAMNATGSGMIIYLRLPGARACGVFSDGHTDVGRVSETVAWILRDLGVYTVRLDDDAPELGLLMFGAIREHGLCVESRPSVWSAAG